MQVTPNVLYDQLGHILMADLVPMVSGSPGVGKSDIAGKAIAQRFNLEMIDTRLTYKENVDLVGFPGIENGRSIYRPPAEIPIDGMDEIPKGKTGWLLFLDEFNSATASTQAAAYQIILDRMCGQHRIHPNVRIICAGNLDTDGAIVNRMGTAMQSRLVHLELIVSSKEWLEWAAMNDIDYRVSAYIANRPDILHNFKPDHNDKTFACPRTWHFASKLIKNQKALKPMLSTISGTISEGVAREFITYTDLCLKLPSINDIIAIGSTLPVDTEPSMLFAASHMIAANMDVANADTVMTYVNRLPVEFGLVTLRRATARVPELIKTTEIRKWKSQLADNNF